MQYGIPYMGSKSKIARSIALNLPAGDHFYDLFGGGFSMTDFVMRHRGSKYKHFHYNEINSDVVELVKKAINGDFNYDKFKPEWISREKFFELKDSSAYVRCLWSFGNNQKGYLFGKDIEPYKKSMHQAVVFDEFDDTASAMFGFSKWPTSLDTIIARRLYLLERIRFFKKTKPKEKLQKLFINTGERQLQQLEQLDRLQQLEQLDRLQQLEQLQRLERLQQLEQLERLERLSFYSGEYRDVPIKNNSVVYCDIPYAGAAEYLSKFNHKEFFDWAATRDFPVFISEYSIKDPRFKLVYSVDKRSMLDNNREKQMVKSEKLYWNGVSNGGSIG